MVERGVRMVQIYFGKRQPWDSHDDGPAKQADGPIGALVQDLKSRGLLDETLVVVGSEFGWDAVRPEDWRHGCRCRPRSQRERLYHATILHLLGLDHTSVVSLK